MLTGDKVREPPVPGLIVTAEMVPGTLVNCRLSMVKAASSVVVIWVPEENGAPVALKITVALD